MTPGDPRLRGSEAGAVDPTEALDRTDLWMAILVALVAVAFQWPIHDRWLSLQDEGYILAIADDLNRGNVLYRDVTSDAPFPGAFYLLAWWFRLTGPSIESSRILAVGGFALYCAALYRIARDLLSRRWSWGVVVALLGYRVWAFPHWHIYSYSLVSAVFLTVAVALACAYRRRRSLGLIVLAGLCAGAGLLCKQNYGLAVTGALGLALLLFPWLDPQRRPSVREALAPGATLGLATLAVVAPAIGWLASQGALDAMLDQTFGYPFRLMALRSFPGLPDLWPLFGQDPAFRAEIGSYFPAILATLWWYPCPGCLVSEMSRGPLWQTTAFWDVSLKLVYWAPLVAYFAAALLWGTTIVRRRLRGESPADSEKRLLLLAFAGGFLLAFNKPRDWVHLMMVYPPALVVGAVLLRDGLRRLPRPARRAGDAAIVAALAAVMLVSIALMRDLRHRVDWWLDMPRAGVFADPQNGPIIDDVVEYAEAKVPASEPLPVYPVQPMLGFLAGRPTAGGYYVVWPGQSESRDETIIADFEAENVSHVIYSVSQFEHLGSFRENAPDLFTYLVDHFQIDRVFSREPHGPIVLGLRRRAPRSIYRITVGGITKARRPRVWKTWPFARILSPPLATPVRIPVRVPEDRPVLSFSYGVNPERWLDVKGGPFTFRIRANEPFKRDEAIVFEGRVDPAADVRDRAWRRGRLDLRRFAGKPIVLEFSVDSERPDPGPTNLVGWTDPMFVAPARRPTG